MNTRERKKDSERNQQKLKHYYYYIFGELIEVRVISLFPYFIRSLREDRSSTRKETVAADEWT